MGYLQTKWRIEQVSYNTYKLASKNICIEQQEIVKEDNVIKKHTK